MQLFANALQKIMNKVKVIRDRKSTEILASTKEKIMNRCKEAQGHIESDLYVYKKKLLLFVHVNSTIVWVVFAPLFWWCRNEYKKLSMERFGQLQLQLQGIALPNSSYMKNEFTKIQYEISLPHDEQMNTKHSKPPRKSGRMKCILTWSISKIFLLKSKPQRVTLTVFVISRVIFGAIFAYSCRNAAWKSLMYTFFKRQTEIAHKKLYSKANEFAEQYIKEAEQQLLTLQKVSFKWCFAFWLSIKVINSKIQFAMQAALESRNDLKKTILDIL